MPGFGHNQNNHLSEINEENESQDVYTTDRNTDVKIVTVVNTIEDEENE